MNRTKQNKLLKERNKTKLIAINMRGGKRNTKQKQETTTNTHDETKRKQNKLSKKK